VCVCVCLCVCVCVCVCVCAERGGGTSSHEKNLKILQAAPVISLLVLLALLARRAPSCACSAVLQACSYIMRVVCEALRVSCGLLVGSPSGCRG
jgi:hypothetical protein